MKTQLLWLDAAMHRNSVPRAQVHEIFREQAIFISFEKRAAFKYYICIVKPHVCVAPRSVDKVSDGCQQLVP